MLTRRHIRVKVLQSIYAYNQAENKDLEKQEKFLLYNMEQMQDLYLLMIQLLIIILLFWQTATDFGLRMKGVNCFFIKR